MHRSYSNDQLFHSFALIYMIGLVTRMCVAIGKYFSFRISFITILSLLEFEKSNYSRLG